MVRPELEIDFFTPAALADPYPLYERVRAQGDVVWNPKLAAWMVVGFEAGVDVLSDGGSRFTVLNGDPEITFWFEAPNMIAVDGTEHRRLRTALAPLFTRRSVQKWEQRVADVVADMLAPLAAGTQDVDLIAGFTMLPTIIVADMLGVPDDRHEDMRRWSDTIAGNLSYGSEDDAVRAVMKFASDEINTYLREEIERHRRDRPDDLLTTMLDLLGDSDDDEAMSEDEIRSTGVLLLIAAYHTTSKTLANTLIALEANPDQRELVVADASLIPATIEEAMRWHGSVQFVPRRAVHDVEVGGTPIAAGENLFTVIAACNRDPDRWPEPNRFDVRRQLKTNLSFGFGPHLCVGAHLARLEVKVALERFLELAPDFRMRDVDFGHSFSIRGPESGIVEVGRVASEG